MTDDRSRLRLLAASRSITGPYRDHNEDNLHCDVAGGLFVVADGMGGQQAGERASALVMELLPPLLAKIAGEGIAATKSVKDRVAWAIGQVNQAIHNFGQTHPECRQMGTTVVLALRLDDKLYISGIGDSRVYHLRGVSIRQVTTDHTVAEALVQRGVITPEQSRVHKFRHVLWRYLGSADLGELPEVHEIVLEAGDRFLLASDGLTGVVEDAELARILGSSRDPDEAATQLERRSQELDSHDNVTCLVLAVELEPPA